MLDHEESKATNLNVKDFYEWTHRSKNETDFWAYFQTLCCAQSSRYACTPEKIELINPLLHKKIHTWLNMFCDAFTVNLLICQKL